MRRLFFLLLLLTCWLSACISYSDGDLKKADRFLNEKKYSEAIIAYDKIAKESIGSKRGALALYDAAFTYAFYDNPQKDYAQALQEFDEFLRLYPNNEKARDAQNWRHILRTMLEFKKENEHLTRSIEQLKKIDIRHEEKRGKK